jgi:regulator of cell morphogenesis and NO signaling
MLETWALLRDFGPHAAHSPPDEAREIRELIAHIIERYHEVHRAEFPQAIALARKVEGVHRDVAEAPHGLADHLQLMFDDLDAHQRREELVLFPTLEAGGCSVARFAIQRMMADHRDVEGQLATLRKLAGDYQPPAGACRTWRALLESCRKLDDDLTEHMRLEDDDLFPRFL